MRLVVDRTKRVVDSVLVYKMQEYAFATEPRPAGADTSLSANEVQLMVSGKDHQLLFVTGYCPYQSWHQTFLHVPSFTRAGLVVAEIDLQPGISIQLNRREARWPVQVDVQSGWVCIGDAQSKGEGIEFAPGCVAVILDGQLVAIWLQPKEIPRAVMRHLPS
jgi:hypothetical protein